MRTVKRLRPTWDDLRKLYKCSVVIITDSDLVRGACKIDSRTKGLIFPNFMNIAFGSPQAPFATIVLFTDIIVDKEEFVETLLHELVHLYLFKKGELIQDEDWVDKEAERVYGLYKSQIEKFIRREFGHILKEEPDDS